MVRTHECSCLAPTQHAQTSDPAIVARHSVGTYMMGRMWTPPALPNSCASSQPFPPTPPNAPPPPTLPYPHLITPQPCPPTQPCSPATSIPSSQPRSISNSHSGPPPKTDKNEATRIYGFDLNPHWQEDRDHYDKQKINGLTFPRAIRQSAFMQKLDIEGCDPLSLPVAALMYQKANNHWLRKVAHGRETYLIPTGGIAAVVFTMELLTQLRNRGIPGQGLPSSGQTGWKIVGQDCQHQVCRATDRRTARKLVTSQGHGSRLPT